MKPIPSEWLQPGAIVPVTAETVRELLECVRVAYKAGQEAEREACAELCDRRMSLYWMQVDKGGCDEDRAAAIASEECADAIRARGQQ